ncbi:hypothetical protein HBB16_03850 [Pseudonocardia sp. MCCB 268]|nr:hypothetical protein [Pseudonocardia cytotoxica]
MTIVHGGARCRGTVRRRRAPPAALAGRSPSFAASIAAGTGAGAARLDQRLARERLVARSPHHRDLRGVRDRPRSPSTPAATGRSARWVIRRLIQLGGLGLMTVSSLLVVLVSWRLGCARDPVAQAQSRTFSTWPTSGVANIRNVVVFSIAAELVVTTGPRGSGSASPTRCRSAAP